MKITGQRTDGALYLSMGGGLAVILKGEKVSPTQDESVVEGMGPWSPGDNSFHTRRATSRALELARVARLDYFALDWDEGQHPRDESGKFASGGDSGGLKPGGWGGFSSEHSGTGEREAAKKQLLEEARPAQNTPHTESDWAKYSAPTVPVLKVPYVPGQTARFDGTAADGSVIGSMPVTVVTPHSNAHLVTRVEGTGKKQRAYEGAHSHIPTATVRNARGKQFEAFHHTLTLTQEDHFRALLLSLKGDPVLLLSDKGEHPFTYCKENIIPAMEKKGNAPDDPDAFCAWWKKDNS